MLVLFWTELPVSIQYPLKNPSRQYRWCTQNRWI